jgi:hypothetical protein
MSIEAPSRWGAFSRDELLAISDGLASEEELDPNEDPSFPQRVTIASHLRDEIETELRSLNYRAPGT